MTHVDELYSEKFNSLSLLQDERFTNLDGTLRQVIEPLLHELVSIHSKVDRAIILNSEHLATKSLREDEQTNSILLEGLRFSTMTHRHAEIAIAH
jgi:hypothetical protein